MTPAADKKEKTPIAAAMTNPMISRAMSPASHLMPFNGEATNGKEAVDAAKKWRPDVVVMDLMMPVCNGADAAAAIHDAAPEVKIMILTTFGAANDIALALKNGATGAVMKSMTNDELVDAIRRVAAGERVVSPEIERMMAELEPLPELSQRQLQILDSITRGLSNSEISMQYGISPESVKTHTAKLFAKIGAANRAEAAGIALRRHLLKM